MALFHHIRVAFGESRGSPFVRRFLAWFRRDASHNLQKTIKAHNQFDNVKSVLEFGDDGANGIELDEVDNI